MPLWQHYYLAKSIPDALEALAQAPGPARIVAGGTDLLLDLGQGRHPGVHTLVDVASIPELRALETRGDQLFIGASVPLSKVVEAPYVRDHARALAEACHLIGGPQVRNTATLGGNVGHALPAADGTIALLALGAEVEIASSVETRRMPLQDIFSGPGKSSLLPREEIILGFYVPLRKPGQASAFRRVMRPQGVALPTLNMAIWLHRQQRSIAAIRISIGPAGSIPMRARAAEETLKGSLVNGESLRFAQAAILDELHFRSSPHRASAEYRRHLSSVLLDETLSAAWHRAGDEDE
ncbi:MAG TPA: FAD binding domain-containing protein [Anaerolineales bacterium]|nr:FAD binding domain-containing protein [Anaerolineales bacterium]